MNIKVFNMLSRINETRKIVWHETCKCICRLTSAICNDKQEWNENKCSCECKEDLVSNLACDKGYMWNLSTCACECDKFCDIGQYLDYKNCVCRKKLIDDLIEQCTSIIDMSNDDNIICDEIKNVNNTVNNQLKDINSNVYMILFIVGLIVSAFLIGGLVFYCRKRNTKKIK